MTVNLSALAGAGQQFLDNNGNPLSGGKLWSYEAGTSTPQTTYTTVAGSVAHTNPIVLDSAGRVATGEIWLTAGDNYKFVLMTSTDVVLATWDNITGINGTGIATNAANVAYDPPFAGSISTTVEAKLSKYITPLDFGAVGDGVANDTVKVQNAVDALLPGETLDLVGLTYAITGVVVSTNEVKITNGRFVATTGVSGALLKVTANNVVVEKVNTFVDGSAYGAVPLGGIGFDGCTNGWILNCHCDGGQLVLPYSADCNPIAVFNSSNVIIDGCVAINGYFTENIFVNDSTDCKINNCYSSNSDYSALALVASPNVAGRHIVTNNTFVDCNTSIITVDCDECIVSNNVIKNSPLNGINLGHTGTNTANRTIVSENRISGCNAYGIACTDSTGVQIINNNIDTVGNGIRISDNANNVSIQGNYIENTSLSGLLFSIGDKNFFASIKSNFVKNVSLHGIEINGGDKYEIIDNTFVNVNQANTSNNWVQYVGFGPTYTPQRMIVRGNSCLLDSDATSLGAGRGVNVTNSVAGFVFSMEDNIIPAVRFEFAAFAGVSPTAPSVRNNRRTSDPMASSVTLAGGSTSITVTNGNMSGYQPPKLIARDANSGIRNVFVSSFGYGTFTISSATVGLDAVIGYEVS